MNTQSNESTEKNWDQIKTKIKSKWGKFNDNELEGFKSDMSQLSGKIQKVYGVAKDQADKQYDEFKTSIQSLLTTQEKAGPKKEEDAK